MTSPSDLSITITLNHWCAYTHKMLKNNKEAFNSASERIKELYSKIAPSSSLFPYIESAKNLLPETAQLSSSILKHLENVIIATAAFSKEKSSANFSIIQQHYTLMYKEDVERNRLFKSINDSLDKVSAAQAMISMSNSK